MTRPSPVLAALPGSAFDAAETRRAVEEVLSRSAFSGARPSGLDAVWADVRAWLATRLADLLEVATAGPLSWAVLALLIGIVLLVAWRVARRVGTDPVTAGARGVTVRRRPPQDWIAEAIEHERAERWRDAIRARYRAVVAALGEAGVLDEVPGRTVGEYRREVASRDTVRAPSFDRASDLFELAWYAHRSAGPEEAAELTRLARTLTGAGGDRS